MISNYEERTSSFFKVYREIVNQPKYEIDFTNTEIHSYREFADGLSKIIARMPPETKYIKDIDQIIRQLDEVYKNSMLEEILQNNNKLTSIFLNGKYSFFPSKQFNVTTLHSMINLFKASSDDKRKTILNNLWERFDKIIRESDEPENDLPF